MKSTLRLASTFIFALAFTSLATAAPEKEKEAAKTPAKTEKAAAKDKDKDKKDGYPLYGQVVSINTRTLVIKGGEGKEDRKFTLSAATEILKDEKPATVADVVAGQWVGGYVEKAESGNDKLLKLNLSAKQKEEKKDAKEDAAKPKAATTKKTS